MAERFDAGKAVLRNLTKLVSVRDQTEAGRLLQGEGPIPVIICLGYGRCENFLKDGDVVCPMCLRYPTGRGTAALLDGVAKVYARGN